MFAREIHKDQRRKYTGTPYIEHLAEVAAIAMSVGWHVAEIHPDRLMAVAWLHDSIEDQGITYEYLEARFDRTVAEGVRWLSDVETGTRKERKAASRARLATAPGWVQTIKLADLISNTKSIVQHDPKFAEVYLEEKRLLLAVMKQGDPLLYQLAAGQCESVVAEDSH